jgi:hypothetical protein
MSRLPAALAVFVCLVATTTSSACDDDDSPTSPDDRLILTAQLRPSNEVPAVTNADSSGVGMVTVTLNLTGSGGPTADFHVELAGFANGTVVNASHIHQAVAGVNGPVVVDLGLTAGQTVLANGSTTIVRNGIPVSQAIAQGLASNTSGFYFNVHTALTPSGAVRGQLSRQ